MGLAERERESEKGIFVLLVAGKRRGEVQFSLLGQLLFEPFVHYPEAIPVQLRSVLRGAGGYPRFSFNLPITPHFESVPWA